MKTVSVRLDVLVLVVFGCLSIALSIVWPPGLSSRLPEDPSRPPSAEGSIIEGNGGGDGPLYWVAPMDPNYRRDGPGKSPMGMDLVPVYDQGLPAGTVEISPSVINNLGVRTAHVAQGMLSDSIETVGYVGFDERQLEEVHARVAGWIRRLHVRADGDPVERDGPLYDIQSPELISAQEELLAALRADDTVLVDASGDKLIGLGVSSGTIERIRDSRTVIPQVPFYAPRTGIVDSLSIGQGAHVTPGKRLLRIASMDPVWIEGEVFESQLARLRTGAAVQIRADAVPGRRWSGTVDYIYPVLDSITRTARLRVVLENADRSLLPNMSTRLSIAADAGRSTLLVERDAVLRTGTMERVVLATGNGRFKSVAVTTGRRSREQVQILEGLESGDEVVVSAQFLIDSESSISSDFLRMSEPEAPPETVWATGVVDDLYAEEGIAAITHEPVPEWDWPVMSMEFSIDETAVDIARLIRGQTIRFRMSKADDGDYRIDAIEAVEAGAALR